MDTGRSVTFASFHQANNRLFNHCVHLSRKVRAQASPRTPTYPRELVLCRYRLSHRHLAQARLVQHDDAARPRRLNETGLPELAHGLGDGLARARHHAGEVVVGKAYPQSPPPATLLPEALR